MYLKTMEILSSRLDVISFVKDNTITCRDNWFPAAKNNRLISKKQGMVYYANVSFFYWMVKVADKSLVGSALGPTSTVCATDSTVHLELVMSQ